MDEKEVETLLTDALNPSRLDDEALSTLLDMVTETRTFEDGGVLTMNKGLTVTLDDGSEFQVTLVKSR